MIELVVFSHLHGYLLFLALLLGSLILLLRGRRAAGPRRAALGGAWILTGLSAFTYEMGQWYAVLAGLFLAATRYRARGARALALFAAFAAILPLYQAVNHFDRLAHRGQFPDEKTGQALVARALTPATLKNAGRFIVYTALQPFVPSAEKDSYFEGRLSVPEWAWNGDAPRLGPAPSRRPGGGPGRGARTGRRRAAGPPGPPGDLGYFPSLLLSICRLRRAERPGPNEPPPRTGHPQPQLLLRLSGVAAGVGGRLHRLARTATGRPRRRPAGGCCCSAWSPCRCPRLGSTPGQ